MEAITDKEARLLISALQTQVASVQQQLGNVQQTVAILPPVIPVPTPQAVNQIRNGTFSHSVGSWDNDATADDRRYECAWWYSHPLTAAQPMFKNTTTSGNCTLTFTNADVDTGADTITITNHWLDTGMGVQFTTTGTLPAPLVAGTDYFVYRVDANTIKLGASSADLQRVSPVFINLTTTGAGTSTVHFNYTVKQSSHTYYSSGVTNWDWTTGSSRPHGLWSLDALIPGNNIDPGYSFYAIFDCVRTSQYVTAAAGTRIFAGIYHHSTLAGWEFIQAPFEITDTVVGTVTTPTSRDYLVETITDRGFTVSSSVLTEANAPSDTDFGNGARVVLSWRNVLNFGVQTYRIYRNTGGTYRLLKEITTGITTYIDNNSFVSAAGGYPSTDFSALIAYTSTIPDVLGTIPFAGDPLNPLWATVPFAIKIPQNYNKSDSILADGQWLRWGLTAGLDYSIPGCTATFGSSDILAPSGAAIAALVGKSCDIISASFGTQSATISSVVGDTISIFPSSVSLGHGTFDVTVYVYEGGEDGMYVDLAHLSYVAGAAFSPNAEDISPSRGSRRSLRTERRKAAQARAEAGRAATAIRSACSRKRW
jgi:hypothetical protein